MGPPPQPLIALIVYTSLYYTQTVGRGGKVKEHHLVSEAIETRIIPSICLLHAQYSPSNWQWWIICFQCPFLKFTLAPNALSVTGAIIVFFFGDEKRGVATQMIYESQWFTWKICLNMTNLKMFHIRLSVWKLRMAVKLYHRFLFFFFFLTIPSCVSKCTCTAAGFLNTQILK